MKQENLEKELIMKKLTVENLNEFIESLRRLFLPLGIMQILEIARKEAFNLVESIETKKISNSAFEGAQNLLYIERVTRQI